MLFTLTIRAAGSAETPVHFACHFIVTAVRTRNVTCTSVCKFCPMATRVPRVGHNALLHIFGQQITLVPLLAFKWRNTRRQPPVSTQLLLRSSVSWASFYLTAAMSVLVALIHDTIMSIAVVPFAALTSPTAELRNVPKLHPTSRPAWIDFHSSYTRFDRRDKHS